MKRLTLGLRVLIGGSVLGVGLIAGPLTPLKASAYVAPCRSDPYVLLSDGAQIDLSANISDSMSDVRQVTYILHGPVGVYPIAVVPTDGAMGWVERFQYFGSNQARTYDSYTIVNTGASSVPVTAVSVIASLPSTSAQTAPGFDEQELHIHMSGWGG